MKGISWATGKASVQGLHTPKTYDGIGKIAIVLAFPRSIIRGAAFAECRWWWCPIQLCHVMPGAASTWRFRTRRDGRFGRSGIGRAWRTGSSSICLCGVFMFLEGFYQVAMGFTIINHHLGKLLLFPKPPTRKTRVLDPHEGAKHQRGKA